jgi:hypothetical protein
MMTMLHHNTIRRFRLDVTTRFDGWFPGDLRSVNVVPVDNYQLKSQDILHLPSPVGLTAADTVVAPEITPDGSTKVCTARTTLLSLVTN